MYKDDEEYKLSDRLMSILKSADYGMEKSFGNVALDTDLNVDDVNSYTGFSNRLTSIMASTQGLDEFKKGIEETNKTLRGYQSLINSIEEDKMKRMVQNDNKEETIQVDKTESADNNQRTMLNTINRENIADNNIVINSYDDSTVENLAKLDRKDRYGKIRSLAVNDDDFSKLNLKVEEYLQSQKAIEKSTKINEDIANNNFWSSFWHVLSTLPTNAVDSFIQTGATLIDLTKKSFKNYNKDRLVDAAKLTTNKNELVNSNIDNSMVRTLGSVGLTIGDMVPSIVADVMAPGSGIGVSAVNSGSSAYLETLNDEHSNKEKALDTGVLKGATTFGTEKITGGNFLSKGSLDDIAKKAIESNVSSKVGKRIASKVYEVGGEMLEEQLENHIGYVIDKVVNDKDVTAEEWFNEFNETNKVTLLTTMVLGAFGLGGNTYKEVINEEALNNIDTKTKESINEIQKIMEEDNLTLENEKVDDTFYTILDTDDNGVITGLTKTKGSKIDLDNDDIHVTPVAVLDKNGYFGVIDGDTGVKLDTPGYLTQQEAIDGYSKKMKKIDRATIENINNMVSTAKLDLINKAEQLKALYSYYNENTTMSEVDNLGVNETDMKNNRDVYTEKQYNDITKTVEQISNTALYNYDSTIDTLRTVSNNIKNVSLIEQSGNYYINSLDSDGNIVYQQKIKNMPYTGKRVKDIVNKSIQNADVSFSDEEVNNNMYNSSQNRNVSDFYTEKSNYIIPDIKKAIEQFNVKQEYSVKEMADIWNNEVTENEYDVVYDDYGNIENYVAIEKEGKNLVVNLYNNEDSVVKSEIIPSNNGNYTSTAIRDNIEKVSSLYDENKPIKGQLDIEGNEVKSLKKNKNLDNSMLQNKDIIKSYKNFAKAKEYINIKDILNIANNIEVYHKGTTFIDDKIKNKAGKNQRPKIIEIDQFFTTYSDKEDLRKQAYYYALNTYKNKTVSIKDIDTDVDISQTGIKKTFNKNQDNTKMQTANNLPNIIEEGIYLNSSKSTKNRNLVYHYFFTPISVEGNNELALVTIKEDTSNKNDNHKFYYHDIRQIIKTEKDNAQAMPHNKVSNMLFEQYPSQINNSIPQNTNFVKNDTAINKNMQKLENNSDVYNNIINSINNFTNAKNTVNRKDIDILIENLNIKLKSGAEKIDNTNMFQLSGKNNSPKIVNITKIFEGLTSKNIKDYRKNAESIALELFRDVVVKVYDTKTMVEINKSGIDKTFSGAVTKSKIQTADNLKDIIQQGVYGYTTFNKNDKNNILYHHFFTPVNYENNNGLMRVVIKEFTKDPSIRDRFYYHQLEFISNKKIKGLDTLPHNMETRNFKSSPNINNSISQNTNSVKSDIATNKDMQKLENNSDVYGEKQKNNDESIRNIVKYNQDGREIKDQNYVDFMVERYKDNINISNVETDTHYVENISNKTKKEKIDDLYSQIKDKEFKIIKKLYNENKQLETRQIDLLITKSGLNESFNKGLSDEKYAIVPLLDDIIKTSQDGIIRNETKQRENINEWYYLYNTAKINNELYGIKIDIKKTGQGDRFYVHRVNLINKKGNSNILRTPLEMEKSTNRFPNINNSISQNTNSVKSDTATNKDMQKLENNSQYTNFKELIKQEEQNAISNFKPTINISLSEQIQGIRIKDIKQSEAIKLAKVTFKKNNNKRTFKNQDTGHNIKVIYDDIKESIHKTFSSKNQKKYLKESIASFAQIDSIIGNGKKVSESKELKNRNKYKNWNYYIAQAIINEKPFLIEFDTALEEDGWHFRVERLKEINKKVDTPLATTRKSMLIQGKSTNINNSIPQNTNSVKNDITINNDMQKLENNSDENISSMKKANTKEHNTLSEDVSFMNKGQKNSEIEQEAIQKELHNRIQNAIISKNSKGRTYLGDVSNKVADKIKSLFDIETINRRHVLADNDIRHMIKEHGNPEIEKIKGQIAITLNDIEKIPEILKSYDKIVSGNDNKQGKTIRYIKKYSNNISYVVEVIPEKGKALKIKTMWKKTVRVTNSLKTPSSTSKTKSNLDYSTLQNHIGSNTSIAKNTEIVKDEPVAFVKRNAKDKKLEIDKTKRNAERAEAYIEQEIQKIEKTGNWDNSIPVTRLTDIRKMIEDYLGLSIKKGKFKYDAYGIYKQNRDVLRTEEYKDIDTILHETGHALDLGNRLNVDKESISDELLTAIGKLDVYENETRSTKLAEGFAEVIREYTIIPKQAKAEYPQTVAILEKLQQNDKSFNNFIENVQQQIYNYIHQSPRNREFNNMSVGKRTDEVPLTKNLLKQEVMRNIYDKDWALKSAVNELQKRGGKTIQDLKASDNAYYLTRLASGIGDKVISMLGDGYIDESGNKLFPGLNKIGEIFESEQQELNTPKKDRQQNMKERFNDLRVYLVARSDMDYKSKNLKSGLRTSDSMAVIEQFKNDVKIQEASTIIYDTLDGVLQYAVQNGVITEEIADKLRKSNAFYVPMHRVFDNRGNTVGRKGAVTDIINKRIGSELDIKDVLENVIANSSNVIQQVENNNILKALYRQGEEIGLTGRIYDVVDASKVKVGTAKLSTWENELKKQGVDTSKLDLEKTIDIFAPNNKVDSKNLITSFINDDGKRVYLQFNDDVLFNSLMNMDKQFMSNVLKINSVLNIPLRFGATMANIGFAIPNMISDTVQATVYSKAGFIPIIDNALGVLDILATNNKYVSEFVRKVSPEYSRKINELYTIYSQTGATSSTRLSQYRKSTQKVMKDVYGSRNSKVLGIDERFKPLKRLLDFMTYIPELSEQSTRFEVFKKNYGYYKNNGNSEIDSRILAALESRDATQDFGRTGNFTREINQLIPFSAARVGSAYTFSEKVKANPKQVSMRIALLTAMAMLIKELGYKDKEIEELNQRKKDDNFVFKVGDDVITIKKPQGVLRSIINLTEYIQDLATGHIEAGKEGERLKIWLNNAIMDNMPADSIRGLTPNMLTPLIENAVNKDFYYNTDIVKSYDLELPNKDQYYDYNSQFAILLGKLFNYPPAKIDNLFSGYFGGLGTQITNMLDYVSGKMGLSVQKPEMGAESNAVGKRFFVNVNNNSASIDEIYNRKTELMKKKNGGVITGKETTELETITNAISNVSKLNKQIKGIKNDLSLSGKEKAKRIKLLQQERTDTARQALGKKVIYSSSTKKIESTQFYPTNSVLKNNGYSLELTAELKKEYEQFANEYYDKNRGLYDKAKINELKGKAKEYAKGQLMKKYKSHLVKNKK